MPQQSKQHNKIYIGSIRIPVRACVAILCTGIVLSALLYVYLLASTTMNVTLRKTLQNDSRELQSHIADLEAHYLVQRSKLTLEEAKNRNFTESQQVFVYRYSTTESLALGLE